LEVLFADHGRSVWRLVLRLGVPESHADDVVQEVFLTAHQKRDSYRGEGAVQSWLWGIAVRLASRHSRGPLRMVSDDGFQDSQMTDSNPESVATAR
jgi:RNA polymerase sigma-70 factor, ECF subfamily